MLTEAVEGVMTVQLHSFLTSKPDYSGHFTPGKELPVSIKQEACLSVETGLILLWMVPSDFVTSNTAMAVRGSAKRGEFIDQSTTIGF
jgi:hypothetical protein